MSQPTKPTGRKRPPSRSHTEADKMLEVIRQVARKLGKIPSIRDVKRVQAKYSPWEIRKAFGSWRKALVQAGLERENYRILTDDQLIQVLQEYFTINKRTPRAIDFLASQRYPSPNVYILHFGTWNDAIELAGLIPNKKFPR